MFDWTVARLIAADGGDEAALFAVAEVIGRSPEVAVVYTDHDHVGPDGLFIDPPLNRVGMIEI